MKARWIQHPNAIGQQWLAVNEDDEIVATVTEYSGQWVTDVSANAKPGGHRATFISEAAAKKRAEQQLTPAYTFDQPVTGWVYKVQP